MAPTYVKTFLGGRAVANTDDFIPELPPLPPGSEFAYLERRLPEIFGPLSEADIPRVARFGERRSYPDGAMLFEVGKPSPGIFVLLSGRVAFSRRDALGRSIPIWERQGLGHFLGELGQLSGADALVDVQTRGPVEVLLLSPERLRALLVAEVEVGERILRSLTLRRIGLVALGFGGPVLVGPPTDSRMRALQEILLRSGHPHSVLDPETDPDAAGLVARHAAGPDDLPLVICPGGAVLKNPGDIALARYLNVLPNSIRERGYDVTVVGAGPAGLATAVYAASEGLSILVIDDGRTVSTRAVVIASGARYRRPSIPGLDDFEGRGVSYWASPIEARSCRGKDVVLVGGGNSAGQGAVFLSGHAARVLLLIRGSTLSQSMSRYLVDRIAATSNIHVHPLTELTALRGNEGGELEKVRWKNQRTGLENEANVRHVFLFVGADPATEWLRSCDVALDGKGFVKTGAELTLQELVRAGRRDVPRPLETSVPGVFAIGDVRCGSVKRIGGAIGEGAAVVAQLHSYLAELDEQSMGRSSTTPEALL